MKRNLLVFCFVLVIGLLLFVTIYIHNSETIYAKSLEFKGNQVLAVFYIGDTKEHYDYSIIKKYFTSEEIESFKDINIGGEEKYLIVPRYKGNVEVYSLILEEKDNIISNLKDTVSTPFYLTCNNLDIFPNSRIKITTRIGEFVYTPYINPQTGNVVTTDEVLFGNEEI